MNKIKLFFNSLEKKDAFHVLLSSLWCVVISLILGLVILILVNPQNSFAGMGVMLVNNFSFNDGTMLVKYWGETLAKTAPLIVMSIAISFAYKVGLFNLGGSGQYSIGVIFSLVFALQFNLPWIVCLLMAMIGGALWGVIPGILKAYFNVNEVISGILLNWIALYLANFIITSIPNVWDSSIQYSFVIPVNSGSHLPTLGLDNIFGGCTTIGLGVFITILLAVIVAIVLKKTTFGFEIIATGFSKDAAKASGMAEKRNIILTMAISGALAGLAAGIAILSGQAVWGLSSNTPSIGFDGISSAFLGGLSPIGAIFSSYFITHIKDGGTMITDLGFAPQVSDLIVSVIIYSCGFVAFIMQRRREGRETYIMKLWNKIKFQTRFVKNRKEIK